MLILTRRVGETLIIGDDVTITVLDAKGNQIRLGIEAPKEVEVHRKEIYNRLKMERGEMSKEEYEIELQKAKESQTNLFLMSKARYKMENAGNV